jgi:hypothetical protein
VAAIVEIAEIAAADLVIEAVTGAEIAVRAATGAWKARPKSISTN